MPCTDTPLRYPGGKTQLSPFVVDLLKTNRLLGGVYAEPFAGGAGLACRLLLTGKVSEIWLNDIDPAIHAFWESVLHFPDQICDLIDSTPVTMEQWHRQRKKLVEDRSSTVERGFAAFFLNRTNRSGIILGGMIGGHGQLGKYKLDCRFNKEDLVGKIRRIALYRDVVKLSRLDAAACIRAWNRKLPDRSLINIDPPYFVQGRELYMSFYTAADHKRLATIIRSLEQRWMLTYDDVPAIETLYEGLPVHRKSLLYSAQVKRQASELLVLSPRLIPPPALVGVGIDCRDTKTEKLGVLEQSKNGRTLNLQQQ